MHYQSKNIKEHRLSQKKRNSSLGQISYVDAGEGPVVLLVHGVPTSSWLYRNIIHNLIKDGFRVIAPDLLGFGNSDKPDDSEAYAFDKQARRILDLMDSLNIENWTHVLHDAGGPWTWELILEAPHRINSLIILNTIAFKNGFKPPIEFRRESFFGKLYANLYRNRLVCKMMITGTLKNGTTKKKFSKEETEGYTLPMEEGTNKALYHFFTSFASIYERLPQYQKALSELNIPSLIIWGEKDKILVGKNQVPQIVNALKTPPKNVYFLKEGTHYIQEDEPNKLSKLIALFINDRLDVTL